MDVSLLIQQKLTERGLGQRDLADAAQVTESYISQLLGRKKMPPAPARTDIYEKLERFLKLPAGKLAGLADLQRKQELKKKIQSPPLPLFKEVRELLLEKCKRTKRREMRAIFEKEPFGELERLITQKLLDVVKSLAREELNRESWLRIVARDIDLASFGLEIVLNRRVVPAYFKTFEFVEKESSASSVEEPGLRKFLKDRSLCGNATPEEVEFLRQLRFKNGRRPTPLYYYRELQNLRDPLHFPRK